MTRSVLHVCQPTEGGAPTVARDLAADQARRGWRVAVASPKGGPLRHWLAAADVPHLGWEASRRPGPSTLVESARLARHVRRFAPDVVHLHSSKAGLVGRLVMRGRRPTVFQPHAWSFEADPGLLGWGALQWERVSARWADAILCVSEAERERGERARIRGPFRVIPNGVDLDAFRQAGPADREAARRRLRLPDNPLVVCVGRLHRQKGQDLLLAAWPAVRERIPKARLTLVGEGPERPQLEARAVEGVRLVGERGDVAEWLAAADVVAAPSRWEGMSLTVLEAMARGRSVVAFGVAGMRETVGENAGAVVPPGDLRALSDALALRLADPTRAAAEGGAGRRRVERSHDLRRMLDAIASLYEEMVGPRS